MTIRNYYFLVLLLFLFACDSDTVAPEIPNVLVNEQLNLTNIQYNKLRQDNGFVYINGGVRGIIVIRKSASHYIALERNCTFKSTEACATVEADASQLYLIDHCCKSQFDLSGQVIGGPATIRLRQYATSLNGNFLSISN